MTGRIRVLFIDDSGDDVYLAKATLQRAGLALDSRTVQYEDELRYELADWQPDIIVSDFAMPTLNGTRAFDLARELAPETPFLFLSGGALGRIASDVLARGAVGYVEKGDEHSLVECVVVALHLNEIRVDKS